MSTVAYVTDTVCCLKIVAQVGLQFLLESFTCWLAQQSRGCQRPLRRVWAPAKRHWQDAHVLWLNARRQLQHTHLEHFRGQGVATVSRIASLILHTTLLFFHCPVLAVEIWCYYMYNICVGHASLLGTRSLTNCQHIHVETWPAMIQVFVACQRSIPTTLILPKPDLKSSGNIKTLEELTTQCRVDAASAKASVENDAIKIKKKIMEDSWDRWRFFEQDLILVQSNGPYGFLVALFWIIYVFDLPPYVLARLGEFRITNLLIMSIRRWRRNFVGILDIVWNASCRVRWWCVCFGRSWVSVWLCNLPQTSKLCIELCPEALPPCSPNSVKTGQKCP